ncbi:redoxin domain-containing protein [uncultured Duncaniella sp.]|uniref:redoxin domain-containing protein n=1 Tax=uncultured Duncaniella sp. TaxID=2768039 RepID=UPI00266FD2D1|nr:redoxin domain-containing protein [uncultured Duncaniella sp.]
MKHLLIPAAALLALAACNSRPENSFVINGTINSADGELVYFSYDNGNGFISDTATIADGKFTFTGEVPPFGSHGYIKYGEEVVANTGDNTKSFYFGPDDMTIALEKGKVGKATLSGSSLQAKSEEERHLGDTLNEERHALYDSIKAHPENKEKYEARATELFNQWKEMQRDFIAANSDNYVGYDLFKIISDNYPLEVTKKLYEGLSPELKAYDKVIAQSIDAREKIAPGMPAPELKGYDPLREQEVKLSDLKGKYVLIDFWATWCKGCVMELPHIKELYDKYHDKGLEVVALSKDYNINTWKEYISAHDMAPYYNILTYSDTTVDDKGNIVNDELENRQCRLYNIKFIPRTFLVDPEGNLMAHPSRGEETEALLKEIFGF